MSDDRRGHRILVVCLGNICRSPTGEAALREAAHSADVAIDVRSAGTGDWHLGQPPDGRMSAAARARGLELAGVAEQVDAAMLADADLVLAMDRDNHAALERLARASGITTPIRLFRDFDPAAGAGEDVPDPYYGGADGFDEVVEICRRTAVNIVATLHRSPPRDGRDAR
jgi:protein-tyrosine phosphatase